MNVELLTAEEWERKRLPLLRFVRTHGDRGIGSAAWLRLVRLQAAELNLPGTAIAVMFTAGGQPAGVAFAAGCGEEACLAVVHPALRGRGICRSLLARLGMEWGRLSCRVPLGQTASLAACFAAGFVAVGLESLPAGKPALRLEFGQSLSSVRSAGSVSGVSGVSGVKAEAAAGSAAAARG
ncbi:hypothetical protein COLU111180_06055 [Cohnella lubricantis]|uniref:GNAT family N-acetyltransferase n=1 Tax=Cohnella lubricantis TaxID=2163172 RepID=A0A841TC09_9BACL|nr:hypothetical protein [Cohnella lubricantis]MBB6677559.1 hypothetical protein [Cohnella lubricantis]MBP2116555.1 hypothetical protein [Cohnella lubricantis]